MTVPDNKYIDHKFQEIFSSSFYLPEIDICSPEPNGVKTWNICQRMLQKRVRDPNNWNIWGYVL